MIGHALHDSHATRSREAGSLYPCVGATEEGSDAGGLTAEMLSLFLREAAAPLLTAYPSLLTLTTYSSPTLQEWVVKNR